MAIMVEVLQVGLTITGMQLVGLRGVREEEGKIMEGLKIERMVFQ